MNETGLGGTKGHGVGDTRATLFNPSLYVDDSNYGGGILEEGAPESQPVSLYRRLWSARCPGDSKALKIMSSFRTESNTDCSSRWSTQREILSARVTEQTNSVIRTAARSKLLPLVIILVLAFVEVQLSLWRSATYRSNTLGRSGKVEIHLLDWNRERGL